MRVAATMALSCLTALRARHADTYVAFRPEQIQSATANSGAFHPDDPRLAFSPKITAAARETEAYSPEQKQGYGNVGRITDQPTWRERLDSATKVSRRRNIQATLDPYIGVKADGPAGYMALCNANSSSGALLQFNRRHSALHGRTPGSFRVPPCSPGRTMAGTEKPRSTERRNTFTIGVAATADPIFDGWQRGLRSTPTDWRVPIISLCTS